jgi:uncharacterized DUF497 family protein
MIFKKIEWSKNKNIYLIRVRGVGFEDVINKILENKIIDIIDHPNKTKYPNQKIIYLGINNYIYYVPYVEDGNKIFLKTIIPSRKANKKYKTI